MLSITKTHALRQADCLLLLRYCVYVLPAANLDKKKAGIICAGLNATRLDHYRQ